MVDGKQSVTWEQTSFIMAAMCGKPPNKINPYLLSKAKKSSEDDVENELDGLLGLS